MKDISRNRNKNRKRNICKQRSTVKKKICYRKFRYKYTHTEYSNKHLKPTNQLKTHNNCIYPIRFRNDCIVQIINVANRYFSSQLNSELNKKIYRRRYFGQQNEKSYDKLFYISKLVFFFFLLFSKKFFFLSTKKQYKLHQGKKKMLHKIFKSFSFSICLITSIIEIQTHLMIKTKKKKPKIALPKFGTA